MAVVIPGSRVHVVAALMGGALPTDVVAAMALRVMSAPVVRAGAVAAAVSPCIADGREKQRGSRDRYQQGCQPSSHGSSLASCATGDYIRSLSGA
jgi:hypothetical protein